jgi:hypothetical protein
MLRQLEVRLTWIAAIALSLLGLGLLAQASLDLVERRYQEDVLQAGLYARTLSGQLGLRGIDATTIAATIDRIGSRIPTPSRLAVLAPNGQVLLARGDGEGFAIREPVHRADTRVGEVVVYLHPWQHWRVIFTPLVLIVVAVFSAVLVLREALRFSIRRGPLLRDVASASMIDRVSVQDLAMTIREALRRPHDERVSMVSGRVLELNEIYFRLRRLIESLIQTEPESEQRQRLERLLKDSHGGTRFSTGTPKEVRLSAIDVDMRWLSLATLTAYAALRTVLAVSIDGVGLGVGGALAVAAGLFVGLKLSAHSMRAGTPTQFANAGLTLIVIGALVAWLLSPYQGLATPTNASQPWAYGTLRLALQLADAALIAAATTGALWVLQGQIHAARVARDEGAPAMAQSWVVGAVLGIELIGVMLGMSFLAVGGRTTALAATTLLAAGAWGVLILSQWASPAWHGFHFMRETDQSPPRWQDDRSVPYALVAGLIVATVFGTLLTDGLTGGSTSSGYAARLPANWEQWIAFGLGAVLASQISVTPERLMAGAALGVIAASVFAGEPHVPAEWLKVVTIAKAASAFILGFLAWSLRLHAWAQPADPQTQLSRLLQAEIVAMVLVATLLLLGGLLSVALFRYAPWCLVLLGCVAIPWLVMQRGEVPKAPLSSAPSGVVTTQSGSGDAA